MSAQLHAKVRPAAVVGAFYPADSTPLQFKLDDLLGGIERFEPRVEFFRKMDAANVDLKGFTEDFYWQSCGGHLQSVLDTLEYQVKKTEVWTEITMLLIPGKNDSNAEIEAHCRWVRDRLGLEVPLHFTAFHPD